MSQNLDSSCTSPMLSIIVPCYNVERFVSQCVESILAQSFTNFEIIAINDGSSDQTLSILKRYAAQDPRIRVIDKPNSGYGATMNIGLREAQGEWIGIVESDDYIESEMYKTLIEVAINNNLDVAKAQYTRFWEDKPGCRELIDPSNLVKYNEVYTPRLHPKTFLVANSIWSAIYRREFLQKYEIDFLETPGASYQDSSFAFKTFAMAERFIYIDQSLLNYRINSGSSVRSSSNVFAVSLEFEQIVSYAKRWGIFEQLNPTIQYIRTKMYRWNTKRLRGFSSQREFINLYSKELRQSFKCGEIKISREFPLRKVAELWIIAYLPQIYHLLNR